MKTKHVKSFEQKALQLYAREQAIKQYQKLINKIGRIAGFVSATIMLIAACYYCKPAALDIFSVMLLLMFIGFISMVIGFVAMSLCMGLVSDYRYSDTWKQSLLDSLSQDQKREIVAAAIPKHIEKCMKNLVDSGKSIQLAHKEIMSLKRDIKEYQDEIRELNELSETIKTKDYENGKGEIHGTRSSAELRF